MQHMTRGAALHSYFYLFMAKVLRFWNIEQREEKTHPPVAYQSLCKQCRIVYLRYTVTSLSVHLPLPCFCTIKYSCNPWYSALVNQRAFQTDFVIYRPQIALKSVSPYFGEIHPICGSFKGNKHPWKNWFRLISFLSHFGNKLKILIRLYVVYQQLMRIVYHMLYVLYICYALATVVGIISALQITIKMNIGEDGVKKAIMMLVGAILFIISASIVFPAFFGYRIW